MNSKQKTTTMIEETFKQYMETFKEQYQATFVQLQKRVEHLESQKLESDHRMKQLDETIEELRAKKHEVYYQRKLEKLLGGKHFDTPAGEIDVLTSTTLYEIKSWNGFKHAYGQLKEYSKYVPGKQLALIFFGKCRMKKEIKKEYLEDKRKENIDVYQVHDTPDGTVSMEWLNPRTDNMPFVINNDDDVKRVISKFIEEKCDFEKHNKHYRVFANVLWNAFGDWQVDNKITLQIKQSIFYPVIDTLTKSNRQANKVRIDAIKSTGWYGIRLKESTNE